MSEKIERNKATKKKLKVSMVKCFLTVVMIVFCFFLWSSISQEVSTTFQLKAAVNESKTELDKLLDEKQHLVNEKEKLSDENYITSVARGKYLITNGEEQIYSLPSLD